MGFRNRKDPWPQTQRAPCLNLSADEVAAVPGPGGKTNRGWEGLAGGPCLDRRRFRLPSASSSASEPIDPCDGRPSIYPPKRPRHKPHLPVCKVHNFRPLLEPAVASQWLAPMCSRAQPASNGALCCALRALPEYQGEARSRNDPSDRIAESGTPPARSACSTLLLSTGRTHTTGSSLITRA